MLTPLLRVLLGGACLVVIIAGLKATAPVLNIFMLAIVISQSLAPLTEFLMKRKVPPVWAALISVVLVLVIGVVIIGLLGTSLARLTATLPQYESGLLALRDQAFALLEKVGLQARDVLSIEALSPNRIIGLATLFARSLVGVLGHSLFILLLVAFMLIDLALLRLPGSEQVQGLRWMREAEVFGADIRSYVRITGLNGLIAAGANLVVLEALRIPFSITWAALSFFLSFVPVVGFALALIPPALVAMLEFGPGRAALLLAGYVAVNFVTDNIIKPRFMKEGFELSFIDMFFSLLFWGFVFGPVGTILAIPLTLTVNKLRQRFS